MAVPEGKDKEGPTAHPVPFPRVRLGAGPQSERAFRRNCFQEEHGRLLCACVMVDSSELSVWQSPAHQGAQLGICLVRTSRNGAVGGQRRNSKQGDLGTGF